MSTLVDHTNEYVTGTEGREIRPFTHENVSEESHESECLDDKDVDSVS